MVKSSADDDGELQRACEAKLKARRKILMSIRVAKSLGIWGKTSKLGRSHMASPGSRHLQYGLFCSFSNTASACGYVQSTQGIPHLRPAEYKRFRLSRNWRTVNRAYGGVLSGGAVREMIIRAFLVEEQKIVKNVMKIQKANEKLSAKS